MYWQIPKANLELLFPLYNVQTLGPRTQSSGLAESTFLVSSPCSSFHSLFYAHQYKWSFLKTTWCLPFTSCMCWLTFCFSICPKHLHFLLKSASWHLPGILHSLRTHRMLCLALLWYVFDFFFFFGYKHVSHWYMNPIKPWIMYF